MEQNIKEKTGKSVEHWIKLLNDQKFEKHGEMVKYLKSEHEFTHGYANFVALKARSSDAASFDNDELLDKQYKGKESLKLIYDALLREVDKLGGDIEIVPKKANVSIRRKTQFALIQPSTKTRIDLGLKIKNKPLEGRLEGSGPFGTMCTHRVRLAKLEDLDAEVIGYVKEAYNGAG